MPGLARSLPTAWGHLTSQGRSKTAPHLNLIGTRLVDLEQRRLRFLAISAPPRHGKQIAHRELVLTPDGFVRHGDLLVGDFVYHPSGRPTRIVATGPETMATYRVHFTDGASVRCHADHEWRVYDRSRKCYRVVETRELVSRPLRLGPAASRGGRWAFLVDWCDPLVGVEHDLPCDPYTLGVWLGDGSRGKPVVSYAAVDQATIDRVATVYPTQSTWIHATTGVLTSSFAGLKTDLINAGVLHEKHIPEVYQQASLAQRRALLDGLVDTDGSEGPDGRIRFVNTNPQLIAGVERLVRSFGWRTTHTVQAPARSSSGIQGRLPVSTVSWTPRPLSTTRRRGIVAVEPIAPEPGRCIQVESPDGLYLVSDHLVPTHNSQLCSIDFAGWYLGRNPEHRVVLASFDAGLATGFSEQTRDALAEFGPSTFGVGVHPFRTAAANWRLSGGHKGSMRAVGLSGGFTGRGANLLIIDDPVRDANEALSPVFRERVWNWWASTARTRLEPDGVVLVVMTRWSSDDLVGRLKKQAHRPGSDLWTFIDLPALALPGDVLGRRPGEALWPWRYTTDELTSLRLSHSSTRWWSALYQQQPTPPGGSIAKPEWFRILPTLPDTPRLKVRYWDVASTEDVGKGDPDWTVGALVSRHGNNFYIEHLVRVRASPGRVDRIIHQVAMLDGPDVIVREEQEGGSAGPAIIAARQSRMTGFNYAGVPARSKKETNWIPLLVHAELGGVWLARHEGWNQIFLDEIQEAPAGAHDDQLDAVSGAFNELRKLDGAAINEPGARYPLYY